MCKNATCRVERSAVSYPDIGRHIYKLNQEKTLYYDISSDFSILCNRMQSFALFVFHILHSLYTLLK